MKDLRILCVELRNQKYINADLPQSSERDNNHLFVLNNPVDVSVGRLLNFLSTYNMDINGCLSVTP